MVVCKCRKATKLYCFVHKVPVCGECICFPEHQICVVNAYAQWVIDGDYDWPPKCCLCQAVLPEETDPQTTRLGCLHVMHTSCLVSHIKKFPLHTAPARYVCPACPTAIWPPKNFKDSGSRFYAKLKEAILQTGLEKSLFGNYPVTQSEVESQTPPPAFANGPLVHLSTNGETFGNDTAPAARSDSSDIVEINRTSGATLSLNELEPNFIKSSSPGPGATTRKSAVQIEKPNSEISYYADDEDGNRKKYSRRGSFRNKFLRALLPFWPNPPPILPVTATPRKDASHADDASEVRGRHHRPKRMDPRKLLLVIAIMACLATMGILYYRIAQRV